MPQIAVKIRVADPAAMEQMQPQLRAHGLSIRQLLPPLGLITGDIEETQLDSIRDVDGVSAVELEGRAGVPPQPE